MGFRQVISDRWKRMAGSPEGATPSSPLAPTPAAPSAAVVGLVALWREAAAHWRGASADTTVGPAVGRVLALEARVAASGGAIDDALAKDLLASLRELTLPPLTRLRQRIDDLTHGSRAHQRAASAHQLKLTHLQDEIARCRTMIEQECRRRGIDLTSRPAEDDNLHDLLYQVFKAISHSGSRRMQAAGADPVLSEIERLITSEDPAAVEAFPAWLRAPAARVLAVVQERNRYKRLLANRGLLPPE